MNTPAENLELITTSAVAKATAPAKKLILFGLLGGIFTGLAAATSSMAAMNLLANPDTYGLGRLVAGMVFVGALACAILVGAELLPGNSLIVAALIKHKISFDQLIRNWILVLSFNIIGAALIAYLISLTGLFSSAGDLYGAISIKIATSKSALDFVPALVSAILCNILICSAVWMATSCKSSATKIIAIFFPITFFVTMGFENSIANAYYIPAGLLAKTNPTLTAAAENIGTNTSVLQPIGLYTNLVPVILGNILGGTLLITTLHLALSPKVTKNSA